MVHIVFDEGKAKREGKWAAGIVGAFTSHSKATTFRDGYAREQYPTMIPSERPVAVHTKRVA